MIGDQHGDWTFLENTKGKHGLILVKCICGVEKKINYHNIINKLSKGCGCRKMEKIKKTNLERYGVECTLKDPGTIEKIKKTNMELYGVENPFDSKEIQERITQTHIKNLGVKYPIQNKSVMAKLEKTNLERYGVEVAMKNKDVSGKVRATNLIRYGYEHCMQNKGIRDKVIQTNLERYGVECTMSLKSFHEKSKIAMIERYGVEHCMQNITIAKKAHKTIAKRSTVIHPDTLEEFYCIGTWEVSTALYLIEKGVSFLKEPVSFKMPDGKHYMPDFYLIEQDLWVEVKGRWIGDARGKWDWFHETHPNSELWDRDKLRELGILTKSYKAVYKLPD